MRHQLKEHAQSKLKICKAKIPVAKVNSENDNTCNGFTAKNGEYYTYWYFLMGGSQY